MKPFEIVKEYFPTASHDELRDVLWGCTGWPYFFQTSPGKNVEACLREQLLKISIRSQQVPTEALRLSEEDMDRAFQEYKQNEPNQCG